MPGSKLAADLVKAGLAGIGRAERRSWLKMVRMLTSCEELRHPSQIVFGVF
jgi:hypothetical protein